MLFLLSILLLSQVSEAKNDTLPKISSRYEAGEELIFTLLLDNYILGEYFVLVTEQGFAVDIESLIAALDFPIENKKNGLYEGWFINPERTFYLNFRDSNLSGGAVARISDEEILIGSDQIVDFAGAKYLTIGAVGRLFPVAFDFDTSKLQANLLPSEPLPLQKKLAREKKQVRNISYDKQAQFPRLRRNYEVLSPQSLDLQLNATYTESADTLTDGYSILGGREIAYLNSRFFMSGNTDEFLQSARLTLSRNFDSGFVSDVLNVNRIEFGDINPVQIGTQSFRGDTLGIVLTNDAGTRELNNQRAVTISGEVQVGWDVELFRNGLLIDRILNIEDGQYDFQDVELYLGENSFKVVLYGPQGQEITRNIDRYVEPSASQNEGFRYRTSLTKLDSSLFNTRNSLANFTSDIFDWSTQITQGLTNATSLNLGWRLQSSEEGTNELVLGFSTLLTDRIRFDLDYAKDSESRQQINAGLRTKIGQQDLNINLRSIEDETSKTDTLSINNRGIIPFSNDFQIDYVNELLYSNNYDSRQYRFINEIGIPLSFGLLNHTIEHRRVESNSPDDDAQVLLDETIGGINFRARFLGVTARAGLNYVYRDSFEIGNYNLDFAWSPKEFIRSRLSLSYAPSVNELFSRLDFGYQTSTFNLSANITHSDIGGFRFGVSTRMSLGGEPFTGDIFYSKRSLANAGSVVVRVFEDLNANAIYDIGEKVLEGVEVRSIQSIAKGKTDENGLALLQGLSTSKITDIQVSTETIDEPYLVPIIEGISILPRQNFIDSIDYPLIYMSEAEGQLIFEDESLVNNKVPPISIALINSNNQVIAETKVEFDGYFYIGDIPPGKYTLIPSKKDLDNYNFQPIEPSSLSFDGESRFVSTEPMVLSNIQTYLGYSVRVASMHNLNLLKAFYESMLVRNIVSVRNYPAFFSNYEEKYALNIGFFKQRGEADSLCLLYKSKNLACEVFQHIQRDFY